MRVHINIIWSNVVSISGCAEQGCKNNSYFLVSFEHRSKSPAEIHHQSKKETELFGEIRIKDSSLTATVRRAEAEKGTRAPAALLLCTRVFFQDFSLDATDVWMKQAGTIQVGPNTVGPTWMLPLKALLNHMVPSISATDLDVNIAKLKGSNMSVILCCLSFYWGHTNISCTHLMRFWMHNPSDTWHMIPLSAFSIKYLGRLSEHPSDVIHDKLFQIQFGSLENTKNFLANV